MFMGKGRGGESASDSGTGLHETFTGQPLILQQAFIPPVDKCAWRNMQETYTDHSCDFMNERYHMNNISSTKNQINRKHNAWESIANSFSIGQHH